MIQVEKICSRCRVSNTAMEFYKDSNLCKPCDLSVKRRRAENDKLKRLERRLGQLPVDNSKATTKGKRYADPDGGKPHKILLTISQTRLADLREFSAIFGVPCADIMRIGIGYYLDYLRGESARLAQFYEQDVEKYSIRAIDDAVYVDKDIHARLSEENAKSICEIYEKQCAEISAKIQKSTGHQE